MIATATRDTTGYRGDTPSSRWAIDYTPATSGVCIAGSQVCKRNDHWSHFKFHVSPDMARQMAADLIDAAEKAEAKRRTNKEGHA